MTGTDGPKTQLRCHHCGREVVETIHTRSAYRVGYYALHTGDVEPTTTVRSEEPGDVVTVMRLIRAVEIFTCVDCYQRPGVRHERERLFRSELRDASDKEAAP